MSVKERVAAHRARMREQGFRLVQVWVPDVRSEHFAAEARRQSLIVAAAASESDDQGFIEDASVGWDD